MKKKKYLLHYPFCICHLEPSLSTKEQNTCFVSFQIISFTKAPFKYDLMDWYLAAQFQFISVK